RHTWMVRLLCENLLQNCPSLFLVGIGLVSRQRCRIESECIERCRFPVLWIAQVHLFHGFLVREGARAMVKLVRVFVECFDRGDVVLFAVSLGAHSLRLFDGSRPLFQPRLRGMFPKGIPQAHGDAPVTHRTVWVHLNDSSEPFVCFFKPEGMQQGDSTLERL